MKKIFILTVSSFSILFSQSKISINTVCKPNPTKEEISNYISVYKGDIIRKKDKNTTISLYHGINDTKKICLEFGTAYILRK